jgi:hypothetical protein
VSSLKVLDVQIPDTFYNVSEDQTIFDYTIVSGSFTTYSSILNKPSVKIPSDLYITGIGFYNNVLTTLTDKSKILSDADAELAVLTFAWNTYYKNKVIITADYSHITTTNLFRFNIYHNSLVNNIGFNQSTTAKIGFLGNSLDITYPIVIDNTNDTLTIKLKYGIGGTIINEVLDVTIQHRSYPTIQTLLSIMNTAFSKSTHSTYELNNINLNIVYNSYTDSVVLYNNSYMVALITTGLSDILNIPSDTDYTPGTNVNYGILIADRQIYHSVELPLIVIDYTEFKHYNGTSVVSYYITPGRYTTATSIIDAINTSSGIPGLLTYDSLSNKVTVTNITNLVHSSGLSELLGFPISTTLFTSIISTTNTSFIYLYVPQIDPVTYIYIHSREIDRIKSECTKGSQEWQKTIISVTSNPLLPDNGFKLNNNNKILLSRKETIEKIDLFFTDDYGNIINFNGGNVNILLSLIKT